MGEPAASPPPDDADVESFLDEAYAAILDAMERGEEPSVPGLCAARPELRARVERLIGVARAVSPVRVRTAPSFAGYEVLSRIGAGGMGEVFLARQLGMGGRLVAIKVLAETVATSARRMEMLRSEALAIARLRHPGVVDVYEFVQGRSELPHEGAREGDDRMAARPIVHAFSMQWIQGLSLAELLAQLREADRATARAALEGALPMLSGAPAAEREPLRFMVGLIARVAQTLHAVHEAGLVHRDIKPSNILLREDGTPLIADFGLSRDVVGTPGCGSERGFSGTRAYASPEQLRGEAPTARSDVFALGVTLREAVAACGAAPRDLAAIIARAIAPEQTARYATAAALADDLDRFLALRPVAANPPGVIRRCAMFARRHRRSVMGTAGGAALALMLAGATVIAVFIAPRRAEMHVTRARLELLSPGHANALWNLEWFGQEPGSKNASFTLDGPARERALAAYRAALLWQPWGERRRAWEGEMRVVEQAVAHHPAGDLPAAGEDDRLAGLAAYLGGDSAGAIDYWQRLAAREDPDAFIDAALGVLYVIRERHALAYPRLEHARSAFPRVGFLAVYHAEAAIGCGDLDRAQRLLEEAEGMENHDPLGAATRVRGDLHLARGELDAAESAYAIFHSVMPVYLIRSARVHAARGDYDAAATALGSQLNPGTSAGVRAEYARFVERWWESLDARARGRAIRSALDRGAASPVSLAFRLREGGFGWGLSGVGDAPALGPSLRVALYADFVALGRPESHASLVRASLGEVARRMEASNMDRWNRMVSYSSTLKDWQAAAWAGPRPRTIGAMIGLLHVPARARAVAAGVALSIASGAYGQATFTRLGDLSGGAFYSLGFDISADASTVVGVSSSSNGASEAFMWRNGVMTPLGDLPGGGFESFVTACSADGSVLVGRGTDDAGFYRAVRWVNGGAPESLGTLPALGGYSLARDVNADGTVIVGECGDGSYSSSPTLQAFRWEAGAMTGLPYPPGTPANNSVAQVISPSGLLMAGRSGTFLNFQACVWDGGGTSSLLPGPAYSDCYYGMSDDGSILTGMAGPSTATFTGARWVNGVYEDLGGLPGASRTYLYRCNADGSVIVGESGGSAVIWTQAAGVRRLQDVLEQEYGLSLSGWNLEGATSVSADGRAIVGYGTNPEGNFEGWLVRLAPPCSPPTVPAPAAQSVHAGKPAVFTVGTVSGAPPFTYQWRRNGASLADSSNVFGCTLPVLTILNATAADAGSYDVVITDACGSTTSAAAALTILCHGDFNGDGALSSQDFFDFIVAFFAGC